MKTTKLTPETVLALNVTELRVLATKVGVKNCSKFPKVELQQLVIATIQPAKVEKKAKKAGVSKSQLLRQEIKAALKEGLSIDSGSLMKVMSEKHKIKMHRSFIITVRNKFKELLG